MKALPEAALASRLEQRLVQRIEAEGPIPVADYMAEANAYYYATRDPFGIAGDFITAPEISQMFGELIGLWMADLWDRAGRPADCRYVELGPGRGTLAADALRAMRNAGFDPRIELVETSMLLRRMQAERVPDARWHRQVETLPDDGPLLVVANEFFDALPIRQHVATAHGWRERWVDRRGGRFVPVEGPAAGTPPPHWPAAPAGTIFESSPASIAVMHALADRIAAQGGGALIFDYGHGRSRTGETLQAVRSHEHADPWSAPGECDLTAHVDFEPLAWAARERGLTAFGPVDQGDWLQAAGIEVRAAALARNAPARGGEIAAAKQRLTAPEQMGRLFKAMALTAPGWPPPGGC